MWKSFSGMIFAFLLIGTLTLAFNVGLVHAQAPVTVYINSDGSVSPSSAPISSVDNVTYTFTANMYNGIVVERNNIVIDGNGYTVQGNQSPSETGLNLTNISNVTIKNINFEDLYYGIYLAGSNNNTVMWNNATANGYGIYLASSSNNTVSGNNATANTIGIGVEYSSNDNTVSGNNATANGVGYNGIGIVLDVSSNNNTVSGNDATANGDYGIWLISSSYNIVSGDNAIANRLYGIYLEAASNNIVSGNYAAGNNVTGIEIDSSSGNVLFSNVLDDNSHNFGVSGSALSDFMNSIDTSNLVNGKPVYYMTSESNLVISPENYPNIGYLAVINCTNVTVQGLTLTNEGQGILLAFTNDSKITNNNVTNNEEGICLSSSSYNSVSGNNATVSSDYGIFLNDSSNNAVSGNNASASSEGIELDYSSYNTVNGNSVTSNRFYGICLYYSNNNTDSGNNATANGVGYNGYGIILESSSNNNTVSGNDATANSYDGIWLDYSSSNTISGNNVTANSRDGIDLFASSINTVNENNVTANSYDGIYLSDSSNNNIVSGSDATANSQYGIWLDSSSDNIVSGNNLTANGYGVYLYDSSNNNYISHNNFVGNGFQALVDSKSVRNAWDDGYPSGGNYWSDYQTKYPNATENGSSGIWNTPYVIDTNDTDYYPLMKPYAGLIQPPETVYINSDGSVSPFSAPISSVDNVTYTFTGNINYPTYNGIVVERNNTVIDGNGYTLQGGQVGDGLTQMGISNVTIRNISVRNFQIDIYLSGSSNDTVSGNNATANEANDIGISLADSSNNIVSGNNVTANIIGIYISSSSNNNVVSSNNVSANVFGILLEGSSNNIMYHNNFVSNTYQASVYNSTNTWDNGCPSGGNYWSDYNGTDLYSGSYQNVTGSDGIGDTPYVIDANNTDYYPLMGMFSDFNVAEGVDVQIVSNSTVSDFQFSGTAILFNVSGANGTTGFCNICVPNSLLNGTLIVFVNGTQVQYSLLSSSNSSLSYLYFTYGHSTEQVTIVPEFPDSLILAIFMLTTLLTFAIYKKKHSHSINGNK